MKSLMPWTWGTRRVPISREEDYPGIYSLQREMNRLFDQFFYGGGLETNVPQLFEEEQLSQFSPKIDLKETPEQILVSAEVPGMSEKDLEVSISDSVLSLRGEKREEKEENVRGYYRMERRYGTFQRTIPLPCEVDSDRVEALFKHGVLRVTLPKTKQAKSEVKSITVKST